MTTQRIIKSAQYEAIDHLMQRVHPDVKEIVRRDLIQIFTRQVAAQRNHLHEMEELNSFAEREVAIGPMWATW